ncbi:T9SS type A sorting domain-containing protein [Flavobacterium sp.]|uniref:T9SS type A sorting domain-containing protein n=1 Tax=Flavobacterium sp. TaxID=239 RepID=UPI0039E669A0
MKKLYTLSFTFLAMAASFAQTTEFFTGTGALSANGWVHHSGTINDQLVILTTPGDSGNSLSYAGLAASTGNRTTIVAGNTEDMNKALTAPITTTAYYSALIKVSDNVGLFDNTVAGDYFLSLGGAVGATVTTLPARVYVHLGGADGTVNFGVLNNSGGTATPSFASADYNIGTTYFVVVKYDLTSNTASLFVNPTPGAAEPAATATNATGTSAAPASILSMVIRQGGTATTGTGNVQIDEIRVADNWAAVTPASLGVNEYQIAGLKVYPNPVKDGNLYITSDSNDTKSVVIFDVLGKQVANTTVNSQAINVSHLNAGVYMVKITEAGKTATKKLVIE